MRNFIENGRKTDVHTLLWRKIKIPKTYWLTNMMTEHCPCKCCADRKSLSFSLLVTAPSSQHYPTEQTNNKPNQNKIPNFTNSSVKKWAPMQDNEFLEPIRKPGINKYSFQVIHQVCHHSNTNGKKKDLRDDHLWETPFSVLLKQHSPYPAKLSHCCMVLRLEHHELNPKTLTENLFHEIMDSLHSNRSSLLFWNMNGKIF